MGLHHHLYDEKDEMRKMMEKTPMFLDLKKQLGFYVDPKEYEAAEKFQTEAKKKSGKHLMVLKRLK